MQVSVNNFRDSFNIYVYNNIIHFPYAKVGASPKFQADRQTPVVAVVIAAGAAGVVVVSWAPYELLFAKTR